MKDVFVFRSEPVLIRMTRIYLAILTMDILLIMIPFPVGRIVTKPLLMLILIWGLFRCKTKISPQYLFLWAGALVFSWFGDLFLMGTDTFFIPGLISFLIAHLFYIAVFLKWNSTNAPSYRSMVFPAVITILFFIWFYRVVLLASDQLFVPVLIYAGVILSMWILAVYRSFRIDELRYWIVVGAALFVVSDAILGYGKFSAPSAPVGGWVMLTYGLAQLFLFMGIYQKMIEKTRGSSLL